MSWIFVECTYHHRRGRILSLEGDPNLSSCPCLPYHRGERYHRYFIAVLACHQPVGEHDFITINMCIPSCLFACPVFGGGDTPSGEESHRFSFYELCVFVAFVHRLCYQTTHQTVVSFTFRSTMPSVLIESHLHVLPVSSPLVEGNVIECHWGSSYFNVFCLHHLWRERGVLRNESHQRFELGGGGELHFSLYLPLGSSFTSQTSSSHLHTSTYSPHPFQPLHHFSLLSPPSTNSLSTKQGHQQRLQSPPRRIRTR